MSTELTTTDVSVGSPAPDSAALAPTPGGDLGEAVATGTAVAGASAGIEQWETGLPEVDAVISAIPADDNDLANQLEQRHAQSLIQARGQLRVLRNALRDSHKAQKAYSELGELDAIKSQLEIANLLFSPVIDPATNQPRRDPETQIALVDPTPFVQYLDENSPGMPEQLLSALLGYRTEVAPGHYDTLANQVFRSWGLDPTRVEDYRNINTLAPVSSAVTALELKNIPPEFHEAYKSIPPSIRNAWDAYDEADQVRMLHDYKERLDSIQFKDEVKRDKATREAREAAEFRAEVAGAQEKYFDTVRRERFSAIANSLRSQVKFSEDAATNTLLHGAVGAMLANLINPELRFVSEEALATLGVKLDHTFDEALDKFNSNANDKVALEMSGDRVRALTAQNAAKDAADQLVAKLTTIALKVATKLGGQMVTAAAAKGTALDSATAARPTTGGSSAPAEGASILPPGVRPGSPEARAFWAQNFPGV